MYRAPGADNGLLKVHELRETAVARLFTADEHSGQAPVWEPPRCKKVLSACMGTLHIARTYAGQGYSGSEQKLLVHSKCVHMH